jgi:hypothetical protein
MCLDRGAKPTLAEFETRVNNRNYDHLCIWQSVGADVDNGFWSMYGARLGTYYTMLRDWDYRQVQDFDLLSAMWATFSKDDAKACVSLGQTLRTRLGLPIVDMDTSGSRFFKHHYRNNFKNSGPMTRE